jgi:hypothetical protein
MKYAHLAKPYLERLDRIEEGCTSILSQAGCWVDGRLIGSRYWPLRRDALEEQHKARKARKMRVVHAWQCWCMVRDLRAMFSVGGDHAVNVAFAAGALESEILEIKTGETIANGKGSRRSEAESEQAKLSALLYLFAKEAYRNHIRLGERSAILSTAENYLALRKDDVLSETYDPLGSANALRKQVGRWKEWGLL